MSLKTLVLAIAEARAAVRAKAAELLTQIQKDLDFNVKNNENGQVVYDELSDLVDDLNDAVTALVYPTITLDSLVYDIILPEIRIDGELVTAEEIETEGDDGAIGTALLASGSNALRIQAPTAEFIVDDTTSDTETELEFTNQTTNAGAGVTYEWDFGDEESSTLENPTHTYAENGTYTVRLTATNAGGLNTKTRTDYIVIS